MIGKLALCFSAPFFVSVSDATPPTYVNILQVKMVICMDGLGMVWCNGVGSYVMAGHVAVMEGCEIDGEPINIIYISDDFDIAIMRIKVFEKPLQINYNKKPNKKPFTNINYTKKLPIQQIIF